MIYIADKTDKKDLLDHVQHLLIAWLWRNIEPVQREAVTAYIEQMRKQPKVMQHVCEFNTFSDRMGFRLTVEVSFDHEQAISDRRANPNLNQRQGHQ